MAPANTATVLPAANDDRIALFDLQRQRARLDGEIKARIDAVLAHGQFILGPEVTLLEERLARFAGAKHAIAVSSGRDALMIALMAMGVKPGDAVFVPAFTFAATAGAVASIGASPVFVDVDAATFNMDPVALDDAIRAVTDAGKLTPRVVMPVDLYGLPADYPAIQAVADRHGLIVLADAAQSFGSALGGRRAGALAPISATSFYPTKPLGCYGDGGAILTEDDGLAESVRMIRSHGRTGTGDEATVLGLTGRLDTIQAAVLLAKLDVFDLELARRREIARALRRGARQCGHRPDGPGRFRKRLRALYDPGRQPGRIEGIARCGRHRQRTLLSSCPASAPGIPRLRRARPAGLGANDPRGAQPAASSRPDRPGSRAGHRRRAGGDGPFLIAASL